MTSSSEETIQAYIERLNRYPDHGAPVSIRITNKRSVPLMLQIEPTGDIAEPLQPDDSYVVVAQGFVTDYGVLEIVIRDADMSVWIEGREGQVFHNGLSAAY